MAEVPFNAIPAEAERQARAAFKEHNAKNTKSPHRQLLVGRKNKEHWVAAREG